MCVLDVVYAFYSIRKSFTALLGPVEKTVMYDAGEAGARAFVRETLKTEVIPVSAEGFKLCVEILTWRNWILSTLLLLLKGSMLSRLGRGSSIKISPGLVFATTRGTFLAYMKVLTGRDDLDMLKSYVKHEVLIRASSW